MSLLRRVRRQAIAERRPIPLSLAPLEFDDHPRILVKLSGHMPVGHIDRAAPDGVDITCSCGRYTYLGHLVARIAEWIREAREEVVDRLLHRIGQADVVATFGRDDVDTTLRVVRAVTGRGQQP